MHRSHSPVNTLLILVALFAVIGGLAIVIVTSPRSWELGPAAWFQTVPTITPIPPSTQTPTSTDVPPTATATATLTPNPALDVPTFTPQPTAASETPTATPSATPTLAPDVRALGIVSVIEGINTGRVRDQPNGQTVIAAVPAGTVVEVLFGGVSVDGVNWLPVRLQNGQVGWMADFLLTLTREQPPR